MSTTFDNSGYVAQPWVEIHEFPGYEIASTGHVRNASTGVFVGDLGDDPDLLWLDRDGESVTSSRKRLRNAAFPQLERWM